MGMGGQTTDVGVKVGTGWAATREFLTFIKQFKPASAFLQLPSPGANFIIAT